MKAIFISLIFSVLYSIAISAQPLCGSYTIGASSADFPSFSAAASQLNNDGICGPVVFNVQPGTYSEQFILNQINGSSQVNTITFQAANGDSSSVKLTRSGLTNYIVKLNGTDFCSFVKLSFKVTNIANSRIFEIANSSNNIKILNSNLEGSTTTNQANSYALIYSANFLDTSTIIANNKLLNGAFGIFLQGVSTSNRESGNIILNNIFENQSYQGVSATYQNRIQITNNIFKTNTTNFTTYSFNLTYSDNFILTGNQAYKGTINISGCNGILSNPNLAANNKLINCGFSISGCNQTDIVYNSVLLNPPSSPQSACVNYDQGNTTCRLTNNNFANLSDGYIYSLSSIYPSAIFYANYNNCYTTGPYIAIKQTTYISNLANWNSISGQDLNSLTANPGFYSDNNLHSYSFDLNGAGQPHSIISTDYDGDARNISSPDIGADEFALKTTDARLEYINIFACTGQTSTPVFTKIKNNSTTQLYTLEIYSSINNVLQTPIYWSGNLSPGEDTTVNIGSYTFSTIAPVPFKAWCRLPNNLNDELNQNDTITKNIQPSLAGTYTIGGTAPDFASIGAAITALKNVGICDSVKFKIRTGTYSGPFTLDSIKGGSPINKVTFTSETGNTNDVTITNNSFGIAHFYINGADNVKFEKIKFSSGQPNNSQINIYNNSKNIEINSCTFFGFQDGFGIKSTDVLSNSNLKISNCLFDQGSTAIHLEGPGTTKQKNSQILNNVFINQPISIVAINQDSLIIRNNLITSTTVHSGTSLLVQNSSNIKVSKNKLSVYSSGISIDGNSNGIISNNLITCNGNHFVSGLNYGSPGLNPAKLIYNTVRVNNTNSESVASQMGSQGYLKNNVLSNLGGGYCLELSYNITSLEIQNLNFNYNNYFTTGNKFAKWDYKFYRTFQDWVTLTGPNDSNSIFVDPNFYSSTNLHISNHIINGQGTNLNQFESEDFDGQPRDLTNPDIGAYEYSLEANDAGILIPPGADIFCSGANTLQVIIINNGTTPITTASISYKINSNPTINYNWSGYLLPGQTNQVNIGSTIFSPSTYYNLKIWSSSPNGISDQRTNNDTIIKIFTNTALSGIYTIGGVSPSFPTITQAVDALKNRAVCGSVTFNIRPGTYFEQITISEIKGVSFLNNITFRAENGDSSSVNIDYSPFSNTLNYTVCLDGAKWISFRNVTVKSSGTTYSRVLDFRNQSSNNNVLSCQIIGRQASPNSLDHVLVWSGGYNSDTALIFNKNLLKFGSHGILMDVDGAHLYPESGLKILKNTFVEQTIRAISLNTQHSPIIKNNQINSTSGYTYTGIYSFYNIGRVIISENTLNTPTAQFSVAIKSEMYNDTSGNYTLIANNMINTLFSGISIISSNNVKIYHNTVKHFYNAGIINNATCSQISIKNNLISSQGVYPGCLGLSYGVTESNYNGLHSDSIFVNHLSVNYYDIPSWSQFSGFDTQSKSGIPSFVSNTDLHLFNDTVFTNSGNYVQEVQRDIDGNLRDVYNPDIGADETGPISIDAGISRIVVKENCNSQDSVFVIIKNLSLNTIEEATVSWNVDQNSQPSVLWSSQILPGDSVQIFLGSLSLTGGTHQIISNLSSSILNQDFNPSNDSLSIQLAVQPCYLVWPGDVNEDLTVDNIDVLYLGLAYNSSGPARDSISVIWNGYNCDNWNQNQLNNENLKYADCNGDGIVNFPDTVAILNNFGLAHLRSASTSSYNQIYPLTLDISPSTASPGDTITGSILVASPADPISSIYGCAYKISLNPSIIQPGSFKVHPNDQWLSLPPFISIGNVNESQGLAYGAVSRINGMDTSGYGKIASFKFIIAQGVAGNYPLNILDATASKTDGNFFSFSSNSPILTISPIGVKETKGFMNANIIPNPVKDEGRLSVSLKNEGDLTVYIYNSEGRLIKESYYPKVTSGYNEFEIFGKLELSPGFYLVKLITKEESVTIRVLKFQ